MLLLEQELLSFLFHLAQVLFKWVELDLVDRFARHIATSLLLLSVACWHWRLDICLWLSARSSSLFQGLALHLLLDDLLEDVGVQLRLSVSFLLVTALGKWLHIRLLLATRFFLGCLFLHLLLNVLLKDIGR